MTAAALFVAAAAVASVVRAVVADLNNPAGLPWGTLAVNLMGSFLAGVATAVGGSALTVIATGGLGALTTFSTFAFEVVDNTGDRPRWVAVCYLVGSLVLGVALATLGMRSV
jgi:CrcB protein